MTRVLRLTPRYLHDADRLGAVTGSARGAAVVQTIRALLREDLLPGTGDVRALLPPTREAFVRRVPHRNLWLWYRIRGDELLVLLLTADPPVPLDE